MKVTAHAIVEYDFDIEIPKDIQENLDAIIDYLLIKDPTDLVCQKTGEHWEGFNCGSLDSIYFHELDKTVSMEDI